MLKTNIHLCEDTACLLKIKTQFVHALSQLNKINEFLNKKFEFNVVSGESNSDNDKTIQENKENSDNIKSSQSSCTLVDSYFISGKNINMGTSVGRNK